MNFYKQQHTYYCGIDLHARKMYVCILAEKGKAKVHQNIQTDAELFFEMIFPYLDDVVVGVECVFCWYWLADLCAEHKIPFVLGHALYMKASHGGKTKMIGLRFQLRPNKCGFRDGEHRGRIELINLFTTR